MKTCKKNSVEHLNCKLYYQQLHWKHLCNLARYWLQAVWGWHNSVETCSSVITCGEIIVYFLVIVQNNKLYYQQLHLKCLCNLARYWLQSVWGWHDSVEKCSSVITCGEIIVYLLVIVQNNKLYYQQLRLKYLCNLARYWLQAVWGWHDSVETCSSVITCGEIIVYLLVIVQNNKLYYQQLRLKYLCNLARYWLQAVWGWHDSVETFSSVIICEIIVRLLVIVQNNKRCTLKQSRYGPGVAQSFQEA